MPGVAHYRHRQDLLPGAVVSACAYESTGLAEGDHRGLPSPWVTFIVSVDGPVRVSGTVDEGDHFDPARPRRTTSSWPACTRSRRGSSSRAEQRGVQLAVHPLAVPALLGCRSGELLAARRPRARGARSGRDRAARAGRLPRGMARAGSTWSRRGCASGRRLRARRPCGPSWSRAWQVAQAAEGRGRVEDLARAVLLSPRQRLRTLMLAETGLSPKQLLRQFRFDGVVARLADGDRDTRAGRCRGRLRRPGAPHPRVPADGGLLAPRSGSRRSAETSKTGRIATGQNDCA